MAGDAKYGRLFTEADVEKLLRVQHDRTWTAAKHDEWEDAPAPRPEEYRPLTVEDAVGWAKGDYQFELTFAPDEPLFLLRGQDKGAPTAIAGYGGKCFVMGAPEAHTRAVETAWEEMSRWQAEHPDRVKVPD